jgi:hypothetical protein
MSMTIKAKDAETELNENAVRDFLIQNPDFFVNRDSLLLKMNLPHQQGGAVSLIEKQVSLLRERNREIKKKLDTYIDIAKTNDSIFSKCQKLVLNLIEAENADAFFAALEKSFRRDFKCTAYSLIALNDEARQFNHFTSAVSESAAREYVGALMKSKKPTLGVLRPSEQDFLFRHQSGKVKSAAVISVKRDTEQIALLAIGSGDSDYFQAGMGTLFIGFIADTLSRLLPRFINPE